MNYRRIATFTVVVDHHLCDLDPRATFFYAPVLDHEGNYITGAGNDARR